MTTYKRITKLSEALESSKITERRAAGRELRELLATPEIRQRLSEEASVGSSDTTMAIRLRRRHALTQFWRLLIGRALACKKSYKTAEDILLPFKLIQSCDVHVDDEFEAGKLSKDEVKKLFKYAMELLKTDEALEVAETEILEYVAYMTSRRQYVAYMRPARQMVELLEEMEQRLLSDDEVPTRVAVAAAKVVKNLVTTASQELGMSLHLILSRCIKLISTWCHAQLEKARAGFPPELPYLVHAAAVLLESDLHLSVAPLTRYGRPIMKATRVHYQRVGDVNRHSMELFMLAHL